MNDWIQLLGGGLLLYLGAEWFVGGASSLALSLRIPQILIGLTVVAYGDRRRGAGRGEWARSRRAR